MTIKDWGPSKVIRETVDAESATWWTTEPFTISPLAWFWTAFERHSDGLAHLIRRQDCAADRHLVQVICIRNRCSEEN
jgi:hypothetical protein